MSEPYPRPDAPPIIPRNPIGWIVLGLLLLTALSSLVSGFSSKDAGNEQARRLEELRSALMTRELVSRLPSTARGGDAVLRRLEREVAPTRAKDGEAAALWVAVRTELREKTAPGDVAPALKSPRVDLRTIGEAYALRPAPALQAKALARTLDERGALSRLAAVHLREAAGVTGARDGLHRSADRYLLAIGLYGAVGLASVVAWIAFLVASLSGTLPRLGPPYEAHVPSDADRLAMRAAALFFVFELLSYAFAATGLSTPYRTFGIGLAMFAAVPLVLRRAPSFDEIVRARGMLGTKILLGFWAFLLEIPVTLVVSLVGARLFQGLPQHEHPAAVALMNARDPLTIVSLLFFGAAVAPFWEETMFRGLLFPALRRVLISPVAAALLSSFLFACIHPQGPGGWLGLMAFAVCSCVLVNRTRSLVPSIVMHAAHNGTLLVIALLMGG